MSVILKNVVSVSVIVLVRISGAGVHVTKIVDVTVDAGKNSVCVVVNVYGGADCVDIIVDVTVIVAGMTGSCGYTSCEQKRARVQGYMNA
jgi:hypothetical protein